jgi:hypothetical protein
MLLVYEGAIELLRAAQLAPRGAAKRLLGVLEGYRGTDRTPKPAR